MQRKRKIEENHGVQKSARLREQNEDDQQTIDILNNDCLLHIFSFLDVISLARLQMVCMRFRDLAEYAHRSVRTLDCELLRVRYKMEPADFIRIAKKVGPFVHKLEFVNLLHNFEAFVPGLKYFTNLKELKIICQHFKGNAKYHRFLAKAFRTLEKVTFEKCRLGDGSLRGILRAKNLKCLIFKKTEIVGTWLGKLRNIETIYFSGLYSLPRPSQLKTFCKHNPNLMEFMHDCDRVFSLDCLSPVFQYLLNLERLVLDPTSYIRYCNEIINLPKLKCLVIRNGLSLSNLLQYLANHDVLKNLDISNCLDSDKDLQVLANFRNLQSLCVKGTKVSNQLLAKLASSDLCEKLEELNVQATTVADEGVAQIVLKSKKLTFLNVMKCDHITDNLISTIAPQLEDRPHQLRINVEGTKITNLLSNKVIHCYN